MTKAIGHRMRRAAVEFDEARLADADRLIEEAALTGAGHLEILRRPSLGLMIPELDPSRSPTPAWIGISNPTMHDKGPDLA